MIELILSILLAVAGIYLGIVILCGLAHLAFWIPAWIFARIALLHARITGQSGSRKGTAG